MKYLKYLLVGGIIMLTSSYTTGTSRISEGIYPGNLIPDFTIQNKSGKELKMSDFKGQKVLLSFWAAYNAESHMKNILFWNKLHKDNGLIKMVSVSLDQSKFLFEKTLQIDGITSESHFLAVADIQSEISSKYHLKKGFKNFLIDENGIILATDVMPDDLENY